MKKTCFFVFVFCFAILFTTSAHADWVLYDDFNKYANIEEMKASGKWNIDPASEAIANFSIVDGRLRIEHLAGHNNETAWAQLIKKPTTILGIKAKTDVESWTGDFRVMIGAFVGFLKNNPDYQSWYEMALRHQWVDWVAPSGAWKDYVYGYACVLSASPDQAWLYDQFYAELGTWKYPAIAGTHYEITTKFDRQKALFQVNAPPDLGKVNFAYVEAIGKLQDPFRGIGTRAGDVSATSVVYIDDVYVYRP